MSASSADRRNMRALSLARCALLAALMCVCAWISIPFGDIAITMQTFALFLSLGLLGGRQGSIVCLVYLLLGAAGLPVFSGFRGGIGVLLGATGGYIVGFLAAAVTYWIVTACFGNRLLVRLAALVLGLAGCYTFGTLWFRLAYLQGDSSVTVWAVIIKCVVPYLLPDLLKLAAALLLTEKLKRHLA